MNNIMNKTWSCKGVIVLVLLLGLALTSIANATKFVENPMVEDLDAAGYNIFDVNDLDVDGDATVGGDLDVTGTITATDIITKGPWVDVCAYASFSAAIDDINNDEVTLLIPDSQVVDVNKTVERNITLWFLRDGELSISDGNTVTINGPVKAGLHKIFAGSGDVSFGSGCFRQVYPQWWGAKGDGEADDTDALQAAFNSIADGQKIVIPPGTYDFNDTLILDNSFVILDCQGTLKWTKTTDGTAVRVGSSSSSYSTRGIRASLRVYNSDTSSDAWDVNSIGVQIRNSFENNITIEQCENFQIGLQLYGDSRSVTYSRFTLGTLEDNKIGVDFKLGNDGENWGWVNQNAFYGGRFGYHYSRDSYAGSRFVNIPYDPCHIPNNNIFYSPCFECGTNYKPDYYVDCNGLANAFIHPRNEGTASIKNVRFGANSIGNVWLAGTYQFDLTTFTDDGSYNSIETRTVRTWGQLTENARYGNITAGGTIEGGSLITGGDIGVSGDTDLLQLAADALTVNGKVGIGTATPSQRLDVISTSKTLIKVQGAGSGDLHAGVILYDTDTNVRGTGVIFNSVETGSQQSWFIGKPYVSTKFQIGYAPQKYSNNASDAVRTAQAVLTISTDGKLGIATTAPTAKLDVNSDILRLRTAKTPASASAAGNAGDICWDANYIYICVATNTWKRAAISSW